MAWGVVAVVQAEMLKIMHNHGAILHQVFIIFEHFNSPLLMNAYLRKENSQLKEFKWIISPNIIMLIQMHVIM